VNAPCGLMDQLTSYFGKPNHLLPIVCQPDIMHEPIPFPKDVFVMGIDSGVKHSVGGNDYGKVRTAAFMGYSIIANFEGVDTKRIKEFRREELPFGGYLCNVRVPYYNANFNKILPKIVSGKDFIKQYGDIFDDITSINPEVKYPLLNATRHAIFENNRVEKFQKAVLSVEKTMSKKIPYKLMGSYMDESNMSYNACGLGSEKTEELVQMAYLARNKGIYGAKITGGGSGGTVAILCVGEKGKQAVRDIWTEFQENNGIEVKLFS
jgi:galactokinase